MDRAFAPIGRHQTVGRLSYWTAVSRRLRPARPARPARPNRPTAQPCCCRHRRHPRQPPLRLRAEWFPRSTPGPPQPVQVTNAGHHRCGEHLLHHGGYLLGDGCWCNRPAPLPAAVCWETKWSQNLPRLPTRTGDKSDGLRTSDCAWCRSPTLSTPVTAVSRRPASRACRGNDCSDTSRSAREIRGGSAVWRLSLTQKWACSAVSGKCVRRNPTCTERRSLQWPQGMMDHTTLPVDV